MKSILKWLLILIGAVLLLGLFLPKTYKVERSTNINAPKTAVMNQIINFKNHEAWSPWQEMDSTIKVTYIGTEGTVGSKMSWTSKNSGTGEQAIKTVTPDRVDMGLHFKEPYDSESDVYFTLADSDKGSTNVTWGMSGKNPFPFNIMMFFMGGMDKMIGKDFTRGLELMKGAAEKAAASNAITVQEVNLPARNFVGIRQTTNMAGAQDGNLFKNNFEKIMSIGGNKLKMAGYPCGVYYLWDEKADKIDFATALPVAERIDLGKDIKAFSVPASKGLLIEYRGGYSGIGKAHEAMDAYMKAKNLLQSIPVIEEYVTDPTIEPDSSKWLTKIYYPIK
ncbi:MAG: GyrI-like domain-containing protein [Saprospiraceae bacterium]|nr:GyrI-like domain-containing protein [Saprospiraceae bacterium]MBP7679545.1 GyrI-like domain-containing protein [Saprospiraceae bacterium]